METGAIKTDLIILFGFAFIVFGCIIDKFYKARGLYGVSLSNKPMPTWLGRLMFLSLGTIFILFGFAHLFFGFGTVR